MELALTVALLALLGWLLCCMLVLRRLQGMDRRVEDARRSIGTIAGKLTGEEPERGRSEPLEGAGEPPSPEQPT